MVHEIIINPDGRIEQSFTCKRQELIVSLDEFPEETYTPFEVINPDSIDIYKDYSSLFFGVYNPHILPEKFDTTFNFFSNLNEDPYLNEEEKELLKGMYLIFHVNKPEKIVHNTLAWSFYNKTEQEGISQVLQKVVDNILEIINESQKSEIPYSDPIANADLYINGIEYYVDNELGQITIVKIPMINEVFKIAEIENEEDFEKLINFVEKVFPGKPSIKVVCPGPIQSVETKLPYELINGNQILIETSYIDIIKSRGDVELKINYTPSKPITDPKVTEVWDPEPRQVDFTTKTNIPSDAILLFDGKSTEAWHHRDGSAAKWKVNKGIMTVNPGTGEILTKEVFGDCQLHLEWRSPKEPNKEGQGKGNSGVFLQDKYEVQILNSYENRTYANGQAASIYKQHIPLVNATKPTGEWNTYDIYFRAPKFDSDGRKISKGTITVVHNGVLVQDHVEIKGTTEYIGLPKTIPHGEGPIVLQDHSNEVSFRNIWIRKL